MEYHSAPNTADAYYDMPKLSQNTRTERSEIQKITLVYDSIYVKWSELVNS